MDLFRPLGLVTKDVLGWVIFALFIVLFVLTVADVAGVLRRWVRRRGDRS